MARIRSVHPGLTTDEAYMQLSMPAKAGWPLLWMQCDDQGVFEWKPVVLKARIFPADAVDFDAVLAEYVKHNQVMMVEIQGKTYGLIRNFRKYQRPKSPNASVPLTEDMRKYVGLINGNFGSASEKAARMEEEGDKMEEVNTPQPPSDEGEGELVEKFLSAYPKGEKSWTVAKSVLRTVLKTTKPEVLLAAASAYAADCRNKNLVGSRFVKHPRNWLSDDVWREWEPPPGAGANLITITSSTPEFSAWLAHYRLAGRNMQFFESREAITVPTRWPPSHPEHKPQEVAQ